MAIAKGDFVEIEYTGSVVANGSMPQLVFDTTKESVAKTSQIYSPTRKYGPLTICVGERQVLSGFDQQLIGKELGSSFVVAIAAQDAFGAKNAKLIRLIPLTRFKDENMMPQPGLQVYIDNVPGVVKTVSSGRVLVDFNHPLAGRDVLFDVQIVSRVTDLTKQLQSIIAGQFKDTTGIVEGTVATITLPQVLPKEYEAIVVTQIKRLIPSLTAVKFGLNLTSSSVGNIASSNLIRSSATSATTTTNATSATTKTQPIKSQIK